MVVRAVAISALAHGLTRQLSFSYAGDRIQTVPLSTCSPEAQRRIFPSSGVVTVHRPGGLATNAMQYPHPGDVFATSQRGNGGSRFRPHQGLRICWLQAPRFAAAEIGGPRVVSASAWSPSLRHHAGMWSRAGTGHRSKWPRATRLRRRSTGTVHPLRGASRNRPGQPQSTRPHRYRFT